MNFSRMSGRVLPLGCAIVFALAAASPAEAATCIGRICGVEQGFQIDHCHIRPGDDAETTDDVCWSSLFDFACEDMGFTQPIACPTSALPDPVLIGLTGQQNLVLSGYNQFRTQVLQPATTRAEERDLEAAEEDETEDDEDESRSLLYLSEITTAFEYEDWELAGNAGETVGARFGWSRQAESGIMLGASASYQDSSPDRGDSTQLLNAQLSFGRGFSTSTMDWSWAAFGSFSDVSGPASDSLFGGGVRVGFARHLEGGKIFSGGVLAQYQSSDELEDDPINVGAGAGFGVPLGDRFALDFELYAVNVIEPEVDDDFFYTGAGMFSVYFSERFALTVGARVLEGIDDLDSITYTVGSSSRF